MIPVTGKNVVVTGVIPGESRTTAEQRLREAGAYVHGSVNATTDVLVTGARVGATKVNAAKAKGITVVPWEQIAWDGAEPFTDPDELVTLPDGTSKRFGDCTTEDVQALLAGLPPVVADVARTRVKQIGPMLALKSDTVPVGPEWSYEIKWDGLRCVAHVQDGAIAMHSRSAKTDYITQFPQIAVELSKLPNCIIDGEIVTHEGGKTEYVVFDCIERDGTDLRGLHLIDRRYNLRAVLAVIEDSDHVARCPVSDNGEGLFNFVREHELEGIVAKKNTSLYLDGARNAVWQKIKVRPAQEFIVVGYTPGEGRRANTFGALLLGYYNADGQLEYAGKVGTGWNDDEHAILQALLDANPHRPGVSPLPPFVPRPIAKDATWIDADAFVVQCEFQRWTEDGRLWHPSYKGQRFDKDAREVVREG